MLEMKDLRTRVPIETMAVIKGMATAFNKEEAEIVRDVLNEWADRISHATRVANKYLEVEGITRQRTE